MPAQDADFAEQGGCYGQPLSISERPFVRRMVVGRLSKIMRLSILLIVVISLCSCEISIGESSVNQVHNYERVGIFKFQTLANEEAVYDAALDVAPIAGYQLVEDMRERVSEDGISFGGLHFRKDGRDRLLTFSPTEGINCYFISVSAYNNEVAAKARSDLNLLQEGIKKTMGEQLLYFGTERCPDIPFQQGAQQGAPSDAPQMARP